MRPGGVRGAVEGKRRRKGKGREGVLDYLWEEGNLNTVHVHVHERSVIETR